MLKLALSIFVSLLKGEQENITLNNLKKTLLATIATAKPLLPFPSCGRWSLSRNMSS